jgi:hypothetical protein
VANIKVLPLRSPYNRKDEGRTSKVIDECLSYMQEIPPVFGRPGWYYDRLTKTAWIELRGRAWAERPEDWLYRFKLLDHEPLAEVEREAIQVLANRNHCPRELLDRLRIDAELQMYDCIRLNGLRARKRFIAYKARLEEGKASDPVYCPSRDDSLPDC